MMRVLLCSIVLNEAEMLPRSLEQHIDWPGNIGWVMVESACRTYATANPGSVTDKGLSTDNTASLANSSVQFIQHGWADGQPGQEKCAARNRYLEIADQLKPDAIIVLDADEFYTKDDQQRINELIQRNPQHWAITLRQRHWWRPIETLPLGKLEVVGGYWGITHCRLWRHQVGMRYSGNHNTPRGAHGFLTTRHVRMDTGPQCIHLGFARSVSHRKSTNRYYVARGEGRVEADGNNRRMYVECRQAWETWRPGRMLPCGAKVVAYNGPVPECLRREV